MRLVIFILLSIVCVGCRCPRQYTPSSYPELPPPFYVPEKIRIALVLGAGGARGMAHIGVLEELEAAGIPIDLIVGCSAGSLVGALYADNPNVEEIKQTVWQLRTSSIFDMDLLNCRYGLSQDKSIKRVLDSHLESQTFEELKIPLVIVATDLYTGELVPIGSGDIAKAVQASCSIPFFFVPCDYMGRILVDGGVINPVPVKVAQDLGADMIIAVDLGEVLPGTYPTNLFSIATRSAEIIFMWQSEICTKDADFVIRPKTCGVGTFNDKMKSELYWAGRYAAQEELPSILEKVNAMAKEKCERMRLVNMPCYTPKIYKDIPNVFQN